VNKYEVSQLKLADILPPAQFKKY